MNSPSLAPVRKVKWGAVLAGVVFAAGLIINAAQSGLHIPAWLMGAATYVVFFGTAYMTKAEGPDPAP
jgi:hypothetical protein